MKRPEDHTPDSDGSLSDTDHVLPPDLDHGQVDDAQVRRAMEVIARSALVPFWTCRLAPTPRVLPNGTKVGKGGQPRTTLSVQGLLVGMLLVAVDRKAMYLTEFTKMIHHRISPVMRAELGVLREAPRRVGDDAATASRPDKAAALREERNALKQVDRLFHAMLAPIDPSPLRKNVVQTKKELYNKALPLTEQDRLDRQLLLDWVTGRLLEATWLMLPRGVRRAWKGSIGHDATFVATWARGHATNSPNASTDPDAAWYMRKGDHKAPDDIGGKHHKDGTPKSKYGYDAEIAIAGADDPDDLRGFPLLALGVRLHRPGFSPGENCVAVLDDISRRHLLADPTTGVALPQGTHPDGPHPEQHPTGRLGADRAYNNSTEDNWILPVLALGYQPVFDYKEEDLGHQGSHQGAVLVDGTLYSPSIRNLPALVNATKDLYDKKITKEQHTTLIVEREQYALRVIEVLRDEDGKPTGAVKYGCNAGGKVGGSRRPTVKCDQKPLSLESTGPNDDRLRVHLPLAVAGEKAPPICTQKTVTFDADVLRKHRQPLAHKGPEWNKVYHSLRNTIEGFNALSKDGSKQPIEPADRRRIRGLAATSLLVAFLLAARNLRKIATFNQDADWNGDGTMTVTKPKAKRARKKILADYHPRHPKTKHKRAVPPGPDTGSPPGDTPEKQRRRQRALRATRRDTTP